MVGKVISMVGTVMASTLESAEVASKVLGARERGFLLDNRASLSGSWVPGSRGCLAEETHRSTGR